MMGLIDDDELHRSQLVQTSCYCLRTPNLYDLAGIHGCARSNDAVLYAHFCKRVVCLFQQFLAMHNK